MWTLDILPALKRTSSTLHRAAAGMTWRIWGGLPRRGGVMVSVAAADRVRYSSGSRRAPRHPDPAMVPRLVHMTRIDSARPVPTVATTKGSYE